MTTPSKQADIFNAYSSLLSITIEYDSVEAIAEQIIHDARLTDSQIDALMTLAEAREKMTLNVVPPNLPRMR